MRKSLVRVRILSHANTINTGAAPVTNQMKGLTPLPFKSMGISPISLSITPKRMLKISSLEEMKWAYPWGPENIRILPQVKPNFR